MLALLLFYSIPSATFITTTLFMEQLLSQLIKKTKQLAIRAQVRYSSWVRYTYAHRDHCTRATTYLAQSNI
jgi:hypothetical protein